MVTTGIIIAAVAMVVAMLNMLVMFISDDMKGFSILIHVLCGIGTIVGVVFVALGLLDHFNIS